MPLHQDDSDQDQQGTADAANIFDWHLDRRVLMNFLTATGAELDVNEYDLAGDDKGTN